MGLIYSYIGYDEVKPKRVYNWKKSSKQIEESQYLNFNNTVDLNLIDLTSNKSFPKIYDQGELGSCTANSLCCALCYDYLNGNTEDKKLQEFEPSRLFLYYKEREKENDILVDNGAVISDGIQCLQTVGVCSETNWPYNILKFTEKPSEECVKEASEHKLINTKAVKQTKKDIETCLSVGLPIVFGFIVYSAMEKLNKDNNYVLSLPEFKEQPLGGHAVLIVGYNSITKLFKIRNSWGETWGDKGHFYMPYDYILNENLCSDFWILTQVQDIESKINKTN